MAKNKGGRPRIKIDLEALGKLAEKQWNDREIAAFFNISLDTLDRRFADQIKLGRDRGRAKLRDIQWRRALEGSDRMIIHMSKHYLGQHEKIETEQKITQNQVIIEKPDGVSLESEIRIEEP